jgi:hypothetical protein
MIPKSMRLVVPIVAPAAEAMKQDKNMKTNTL